MEVFTKLILLACVGQIFCGDYFFSNDTKYYFSAPMRKNWYQAERFCHANGMHLATIHTDEENRILMDVIYSFWTSGTDMGQTDTDFYWSESGHAALFTNWIETHPIKDRKGFILLHGGIHKYRWHHTLSEYKYYFICQDRLFIPSAAKRNMYI